MKCCFTKINFINQLKEEDKAYKKRKIEQYKKDEKLIFLVELILAFIVISSVLVYVISSVFFERETFIFKVCSRMSIILFSLSITIIFTDSYLAILNGLGLVNRTPETEKYIDLLEYQINLEDFLIKTNPIGYEITSQFFEFYDDEECKSFEYIYTIKNLISGDIVTNILPVKVKAVVKNCFVKVPTIDIAKAQLLIPADEKGNVLLEEQDSQSLDSN